MEKKKQNWLVIIVVIVAAIIIWFLFKRNPNLVKDLQNSLPIFGFSNPPIQTFDVGSDAYTPHDYGLPALHNAVRSGCSFCGPRSNATTLAVSGISAPAVYDGGAPLYRAFGF